MGEQLERNFKTIYLFIVTEDYKIAPLWYSKAQFYVLTILST